MDPGTLLGAIAISVARGAGSAGVGALLRSAGLTSTAHAKASQIDQLSGYLSELMQFQIGKDLRDGLALIRQAERESDVDIGSPYLRDAETKFVIAADDPQNSPQDRAAGAYLAAACTYRRGETASATHWIRLSNTWAATAFTSSAYLYAQAGIFTQDFEKRGWPYIQVPEWIRAEYRAQLARVPKWKRFARELGLNQTEYIDTRPVTDRLFPELREAFEFWKAVRTVASDLDASASYTLPRLKAGGGLMFIPVIPISVGQTVVGRAMTIKLLSHEPAPRMHTNWTVSFMTSQDCKATCEERDTPNLSLLSAIDPVESWYRYDQACADQPFTATDDLSPGIRIYIRTEPYAVFRCATSTGDDTVPDFSSFSEKTPRTVVVPDHLNAFLE
ncbi:hypothetical protein ACIBEH_06215 [Nocardia salmonicida]|uniref:hypothetical protein n=1 Tax=Nocardia salmonicida TaxID=53431 RepID=UPI0037A7671D